ncbi:hypothetical protein ACFV42_48230 [Streptomyces solisilvae]|uniref:hypothetical protein n=1 Tax=Streptomyces malaysiensis TaxID=92644 RepID=UPI00368630CC
MATLFFSSRSVRTWAVVAGERYPLDMPTSPVVGIAHETALTELLEHAYCSGVRHPVPLGHGQFSLDAVGLLPQLVHTTAGDELALFQQSHDRRHP